MSSFHGDQGQARSHIKQQRETPPRPWYRRDSGGDPYDIIQVIEDFLLGYRPKHNRICAVVLLIIAYILDNMTDR